MINPDRIRITEQELEQCIDFARRSAPTQQDIEFGQHDVVPRSVDEVSRDTIIGKIAEVAFAKIMHENYGIDIELDFEVYPRGQYDAQDAVVNDWRIDVKGTRQGGHYLLVEWNKLDFRQQEKRLSHVYVMFSVGWDRERDLPNRYVKYAGAITLRALNNNNDWIDTKILRKGECIPGTNARLQADNYGIEFNELNKNLDGLVHTMQNRKPNQNVVDYYLNPNDYSKKEDGTPSDIANPNYEGNAMVEFPRWYLTQYQDENYLYIVLSEDKIDDNSQAYAFMHYDGTIGNKLYISMFVIGGNSSRPMMSIDNIPASTYTDKDFTQNISKNFGGNFLWSNYCERDYIASLLIVMSKRLDLQRAFGFGPKTQYKTGNTVSASFFGKDSVYDEPVNVFHLKNWWGDPYMLGGCGLMSDKSYLTPTICIMYYPGYGLWNHFKEYGIKYTIQPNGSPVGYISQMHPSYGTKFPEKFQGSQTTFYQSYCDWSMSKNEQWSYLLCGESKHVAIGSQSILAYDLTTDHEESLQGKMRVSYRK